MISWSLTKVQDKRSLSFASQKREDSLRVLLRLFFLDGLLKNVHTPFSPRQQLCQRVDSIFVWRSFWRHGTEWETAMAPMLATKFGNLATRFEHSKTRIGHSPTRFRHFGTALTSRPPRTPGPLPPTGAKPEATDSLGSPLPGSAGHPAALLHLLHFLLPIWRLRFNGNYPIFETPLLLDRIAKLLNWTWRDLEWGGSSDKT